MPHTRQEILSFLDRKSMLTLATHGQDAIRCRCMFFAHDPAFTFYLMAGRGSAKLREMVIDPRVTLLAVDESPNMPDTAEAEIIGTAEILAEPSARRLAFELLASRNPAAQIALKLGSEELFTMVRVRPSTLIFRVYHEASSGIGATILDFSGGDSGDIISSTD